MNDFASDVVALKALAKSLGKSGVLYYSISLAERRLPKGEEILTFFTHHANVDAVCLECGAWAYSGGGVTHSIKHCSGHAAVEDMT